VQSLTPHEEEEGEGGGGRGGGEMLVNILQYSGQSLDCSTSVSGPNFINENNRGDRNGRHCSTAF
jgi:hypothetical protein